MDLEGSGWKANLWPSGSPGTKQGRDNQTYLAYPRASCVGRRHPPEGHGAPAVGLPLPNPIRSPIPFPKVASAHSSRWGLGGTGGFPWTKGPRWPRPLTESCGDSLPFTQDIAQFPWKWKTELSLLSRKDTLMSKDRWHLEGTHSSRQRVQLSRLTRHQQPAAQLGKWSSSWDGLGTMGKAGQGDLGPFSHLWGLGQVMCSIPSHWNRDSKYFSAPVRWRLGFFVSFILLMFSFQTHPTKSQFETALITHYNPHRLGMGVCWMEMTLCHSKTSLKRCWLDPILTPC